MIDSTAVDFTRENVNKPAATTAYANIKESNQALDNDFKVSKHVFLHSTPPLHIKRFYKDEGLPIETTNLDHNFNTPQKIIPMSPNARQRKSCLTTDFIEGMGISKVDQMDVINAGIKRLGLIPTKSATHSSIGGRKLTPFSIRKAVWDFYHSNSTQLTNTSRPAKIKVSEKPRIQTGLDFVGTTTIITQRNKKFYESNWFIISFDGLAKTFKELYLEYIREFQDLCLPRYISCSEAILLKLCNSKRY